ncbi:hypothetical protein AALO_G00253070 [Alosa alosa]|uniref:C2H2-type domain-containing protein n=1 Tax=Alosa alosa TaxID=278164 RepID=A0AAV6FNS5_9TELE|nr:hypothetical protein AALO_G00253070 [Alosa alosa]
MLAAATKAQSKMASPSDKGKVTATAVSITKTAALPATSVVSGISVRPVAKATNGGTSAGGGGGGGGGGGVVHQPCKPASIVNSTGAVISRSQSSLVEAFNKILNSKNLLPSYKPDLSAPPPLEWGLGMPAAGYRCLECGDSFALERSLVRHYDRRSLRIEVTCNHCAKRLAFFNKCSLLLHAREHKERGLVMQCSHLVMRPVTVEQMISQQDNAPIGMLSPSPSLSSTPAAPQGTPSVSTATPSPQKDSPSPSATAAAAAATQPSAPRRLPSSPQAIMPLPCKKVDVLQYNNFKCPECQAQFGGKAELVAHFQQIRATPNSVNVYAVHSAHDAAQLVQRMPTSDPLASKAASPARQGGGGVARQASFQAHLEESCLHFARRIGYRCSICQVVFGGLNSIKSHIQTAHCEVFHKCPNCPMAFKSAPSAQSHISTQHPTLTTTQPKMIYKCVMCDTVFTQKPLLYVHFDTHLAKQKVHVFKCPDCTKLYAQKASMMEHMKTVHRGLSVKPETPPTTTTTTTTTTSTTPGTMPLTVQPIPKARGQEGEEWSGEPGEEEGDREGEGGEKEEEEEDEEENEEEEEPESSPESSSMEWKCRECRTRYSEKEDYISHMRKEHGKPMKKFPCRMCERSFSSANSLRRHVRVIHEGIRRVFHCQYCSEGKRTFSSRLILEKHIRVRHGIRSRQPVDRQGPPNTRKRSAPAEGVGSSSEQEGDGAFEEASEGPASGGGGAVKRWRPAATGGAGEASAPHDRDEGVRQEAEESGSGEGGEETTGAATPAGSAPVAAGYKCTPCGFVTEDWAEFQQHIPQHQAEGGVGSAGSLQCTQCGACFASAGSLARHRFITHRLRNETRGHGKNAASSSSSSSSAAAGAASSSSPDNGAAGATPPDDGSPTSPLRGEDGSYGCRVCGRRFDKQPDLNTHFRTHGMAFITAHKNDKPT